MYKQYRRQAFLSQNFLHSPELINKLIRNSSLGKHDIVLEIGPGRGRITKELASIVGEVWAVEKDDDLFKFLTSKYRNYRNIRLYCADILHFNLPTKPYKVFSNIPFSITADIIRKLTTSPNFFEGYLVVQKEAAKKFVGIPYADKNSMMAILLKPWFELEVIWNFKRTDFEPVPKVDVVLLLMKRKYHPDVSQTDKFLFNSFITVLFNRQKVSKKIYRWFLQEFWQFKKVGNKRKIRSIVTIAARIERKQRKVVKIRRTRVDKEWRKYPRRF